MRMASHEPFGVRTPIVFQHRYFRQEEDERNMLTVLVRISSHSSGCFCSHMATTCRNSAESKSMNDHPSSSRLLTGSFGRHVARSRRLSESCRKTDVVDRSRCVICAKGTLLGSLRCEGSEGGVSALSSRMYASCPVLSHPLLLEGLALAFRGAFERLAGFATLVVDRPICLVEAVVEVFPPSIFSLGVI